MNTHDKLRKNIRYYTLSQYLTPAVLIWPIMTLYYSSKGLSFANIALIQSIGAIASMVLDIPTALWADTIGDKRFIFMSGILNCAAVLVLLPSRHFAMFLLAELIFAMAEAAYSGAGQSFFYKNLQCLHQTEQYRKIVAKIRRKQIVVRTLARLCAPFAFSIWKPAVFIFSACIYASMTYFYSRYDESVLKDADSAPQPLHNPAVPAQKKGSTVSIQAIKKYKLFLVISLFSMIILTLVSNYNQYVGPLLKQQGFPISRFGLILVCGSFSSFLGSYIAERTNTTNTLSLMLLLALILTSLFVVFKLFYGSYTTIIVYALISFFHIMFTIVLGDTLNKSIDNTQRATMLSVSSQIDNIGTIMIDPVIGFAIDRCGFRETYGAIGIISFSLFAAFFLVYRIAEYLSS